LYFFFGTCDLEFEIFSLDLVICFLPLSLLPPPGLWQLRFRKATASEAEEPGWEICNFFLEPGI
jgi:hypothetical protein